MGSCLGKEDTPETNIKIKSKIEMPIDCKCGCNSACCITKKKHHVKHHGTTSPV